MVAFIIVAYNSKEYISECLKSIYKSSNQKFIIFLIDNNSSDNIVKYVNEHFPEVIIYSSKKNFGFASGNNIGIKKAIKKKCQYVFLINPDTIIGKYCLDRLIEKADNKTILQPLILIHNKKKKTKLINTSGGILHYLGFSYCGSYRKNQNSIKEDKDIAVASGAAMFIPVNIIKKIGYFDDIFFMYHEDVDLSWRARISGYNIKLINDAIVWHKYCFSQNKNKFFYAERNRLLFLYKNFSLKYLLLIFPVFLLTEIVILFYTLISGWFLLKIKSYLSTMKLIGEEFYYRKMNIKNITKSEKQLKHYFNTEIAFSEIKNPLFYPYNVILKVYWNLINIWI